MASYSMEDIELIRRRSGMSYEEAVALLDYHDGSVARALVDLERNGRLKEEEKKMETTMKKTDAKNQNKFMNFVQQLYKTRVKVKKGDTIILNLSVLFTVLAVILLSPHVTVLGLLLGLLFGYRITIDKDDKDFEIEGVEKMVKSAADNVRSAVNGISKEINSAVEKKQAQKQEKQAEKTEAAKSEEMKSEAVQAQAAAPAEITVDSEEDEGGAMPLNTHMPDLNAGIVRDLERDVNGANVPKIQVPVRVESKEGDVEVETGNDGYHSVTIG